MRLDPARVVPRKVNQRPLRARICLAAASGLAILAAAGCSGTSGPGGSASSTITVAAVPGVDNAPLYLAERDGLFTDSGIHVRIRTETQDIAALNALGSNQAQIAATDYATMLVGKSMHHEPLALLANGYDATTGSLEVLTLPNSKITSPSDLIGKTIAMPDYDAMVSGGAPASLEEAAATKVLGAYVPTPDVENVTWKAMPQATEISDLVNHRAGIQAILLTEPYIFEAQSKYGLVEVMDAASGPTADLPLSGYVADSTWAKKDPAAVADFQSALAKAQSEASITGTIQKVLPAYLKTPAQVADLMTIGTYPASTQVNDVDRVEQFLSSLAMITQVNIQKMITR